MHIEKVKINSFRAFQNETTINLGSNITCISGVNGIGKSTILAILSNIGELAGKKLLNGQKFRGEFANVVLFDNDHDTTGSKKVTVFFAGTDTDIDQLSFRATIQKYKNQKRYRLIPEKTDTRDTESKLPWPSYYLGLSRLSPVGESESAVTSNIPKNISNDILKTHKFIMKEHFDPDDTKTSGHHVKTENSKNANFGITTPTYSSTSNSSGQDNLGQILQVLWSFKELKKELGDEYKGGILCIDELDASLHPGAQNLLLDHLLNISKELNLQIIFTTHSLSLINHCAELQFLEHSAVKTLYFDRDSDSGDISIIENPSLSFIRNGLMAKFSSGSSKEQVLLLTEDEMARKFIRALIRFSKFKRSSELYELKFLDTSIPWNSIITLIKADNDFYNKSITILDGDLHLDRNAIDLQNILRGANFNINSDEFPSHLLLLPIKFSIEKVMINYILALESSAPFYKDTRVFMQGLNKDRIQEIFTETYNSNLDTTDKYKSFFTKDLIRFQDIIIEYWVLDNQDTVDKFIKLIHEKFMRIKSELWPY